MRKWEVEEALLLELNCDCPRAECREIEEAEGNDRNGGEELFYDS